MAVIAIGGGCDLQALMPPRGKENASGSWRTGLTPAAGGVEKMVGLP